MHEGEHLMSTAALKRLIAPTFFLLLVLLPTLYPVSKDLGARLSDSWYQITSHSSYRTPKRG